MQFSTKETNFFIAIKGIIDNLPIKMGRAKLLVDVGNRNWYVERFCACASRGRGTWAWPGSLIGG